MPDAPEHAPYGPLPEGGTVRPMTRWGTPVMHRPQQQVTSYDEELRGAGRRHGRDDVRRGRRRAWRPARSASTSRSSSSTAPTSRASAPSASSATRCSRCPRARDRRLDDGDEGCLSFPGAFVRVRPPRPRHRARHRRSTASRSSSPATACWPAACSTRPTTPWAPSSATGSSTKQRKKLQKQHDKAAEDFPRVLAGLGRPGARCSRPGEGTISRPGPCRHSTR